MTQLSADFFTTLDGFGLGTRSPAYFGYLGQELERWIADELARPQEVLLGRTTYERLAPVSQAGDDEVSGGLTDLPKIVVSRTLEEPLAWSNSRAVRSTDEVRTLKEGTGAPLRSMGSLSLVRSLLELGLVDRLRLMVFP
jgi:dihydrofolate reductase